MGCRCRNWCCGCERFDRREHCRNDGRHCRGRFVGEAGLAHFRRQLGASFDAVPEGSWTIARWAQNRGYATEAAAAALAWMEGRFGTTRTVCMIHVQNAASLQVARKLGYEPTGECMYRGYRALLHRREGPRRQTPPLEISAARP